MKGNFVRGIRNNNPFNIKRSRHPWIGKVTLKDGFDPLFEQFTTMELGCRAGLKLLINYVARGFDTPTKIVQRFAPTSENNTSNYIDFITRNSRGLRFIQPDERIGDIHTLCFLASRMVKYECSLSPIQQSIFKLTVEYFENIVCNYNLNKNHVL